MSDIQPAESMEEYLYPGEISIAGTDIKQETYTKISWVEQHMEDITES